MVLVALLSALLVLAAGFAAVSLRALARAEHAVDMPSRQRFLSAFDGEGVAADVLVETYEVLGRRLAGDGARVTRAARLGADLGFTAADVEDVALLVIARCDGRMPRAHDLDALDDAVRTVGDLVRFVAPFCVRAERPGERGATANGQPRHGLTIVA